MTGVLVVDDDDANLYYLTTLLSNHGCVVESARHGAEALVKARRAPPDVVISDLLMPVMDGYTLLRHWKADPRLRQVPFVVYTATYTDAEDEQLALRLGADAFILKPAEPEEFLERLQQVISNATAAEPLPTKQPDGDEKQLLREYSETLIRKLEEKSLQLEETNRSLQRDIDGRHRAEIALRESETELKRALSDRDKAERDASERAAVLHALFESVPDTVTYLDLEGNIKLINRAPPGADREALLGTPWLSASPPEQREIMQESWAAVVAQGQPTSFESRGQSASDTPTALWNTIAPVMRDGKISGAVVVSRDITERKQTEAQLIVSDRMASVGTLAAGVAHEINNPLASVVVNLTLASEGLELLANHQPIPEDLLDELRDAREGAERVRTIVRDLKIFSRGEDAKLGPVNIEKVMESTLRMAWNELRHRARLVKIYGNVPPAQANESRLGQVMLNLVVNAAQAIPEGQYDRNEIRIETRIDDARPHHVVISVSDTGSGIPPELQRRLFTPFLTTKPVGVGTGLGLSICHRIVTSLGGTIDFSSAVGKGTTFRVSLPMADLRVPAPAPHQETVPLAKRRGSVLVVDDDAMIIHAVERVLSVEHQVRTVQTAEKALDLFVSGERFDVVLCDIMMPQITGQDLYAKLVAVDPRQAARVVFMTGGDFTPAARTFLDSAPNHRIEKPFDVQGLRALVNGLVASKVSAGGV